MRKRMQAGRTMIGLIVLVSMLAGIGPGAGQAQNVTYRYTYSDTSTAVELQGSRHSITDKDMVWIEADDKGKGQVFYRDLGGGEKVQVTSHTAPVEAPLVDRDNAGTVRIVWEDKRNFNSGSGVRNWDVYAYDPASAEEWKLNTSDGDHGNATMDGHLVAWMKSSTYDMYLYDLQKKQETYIGEGRFPVVSNGKVVFKSATDGGLFLYTAATSQTERILELPYHQYVDWFAFKDDTVVWKQSDLDRKTHYAMLRLDGGSSAPVNLTQPSKKTVEHSYIHIGNGQAAWLEYRNGAAQIIGADLSNGQTHQVTNGQTDQRLLGYQGDRIVMVDDKNQLVYRTVVRTVVNTVTTPAAGALSRSILKTIGKDGGILETDGARLTVPEGALDNSITVELTPLDDDDDRSRFPKPQMTLVSGEWEVRAEQHFGKPALLTLAFESAAITDTLLPKIALYRLDPDSKK